LPCCQSGTSEAGPDKEDEFDDPEPMSHLACAKVRSYKRKLLKVTARISHRARILRKILDRNHFFQVTSGFKCAITIIIAIKKNPDRSGTGFLLAVLSYLLAGAALQFLQSERGAIFFKSGSRLKFTGHPVFSFPLIYHKYSGNADTRDNDRRFKA
jgi:hypothetical protein